MSLNNDSKEDTKMKRIKHFFIVIVALRLEAFAAGFVIDNLAKLVFFSNPIRIKRWRLRARILPRCRKKVCITTAILLIVMVSPPIAPSSYAFESNFIRPIGTEEGLARLPSQPNLGVQCIHDPTLPQGAENVTISATAVNSTVDAVLVDSIEIFLNNNMTLPVATAKDVSSLNYTLKPSLDSPLLSYSCRILDNNTTVFSGWKIVRIETIALPIIFTTDTNKALDILLIADNNSYSSPTDPRFLSDVQKAIEAYYNRTDFLKNQDMINFWVAQDMGEARAECDIGPPSNWDSAYAFADVGVILHGDSSIRDCALLGSEELFTTNMELTGTENITLLHETGHRPFGLADEYDGDGAYFVNDQLPNIFRSGELCKQDDSAKGRECRKIASAEGELFFTSDISPDDLMADNLKLQPLDQRRIQWWFDCHRNYNNCNASPSKTNLYLFDYHNTDKSIIARLNFSAPGEAEFVSADVSFVRAHSNIGNPPMLNVQMLDNSGEAVQNFNIWDPMLALVTQENGHEGVENLSNAEARIVTPFNSKIATMLLSSINSTDGSLEEIISVDLRPTIRAFCEEFPDDSNCLVSDLAIVDIRTLEPQLSILSGGGGSANVTLLTTVTNNGYDAPVDAVVSSQPTPSSSSGVRVVTMGHLSQNEEEAMTLLLHNPRQHEDVHRIECLEPGIHDVVLETQIASHSAAVVDANRNNDKGQVSFQIDCGGNLNQPIGQTGPPIPIQCSAGQQEARDNDGDGIAETCIPIQPSPIQCLPDEVAVDTNGDGTNDKCDPNPVPCLPDEIGKDTNGNGIPDTCDPNPVPCLPDEIGKDTNGNGIPDTCDPNPVPCLPDEIGKDTNGNGIPDTCECIGGYERIDGECVPECGDNEERIDGECVPECGDNEERVGSGCECIGGYERIDGECVPECGDNEERNGAKCECIEGYYRGDDGGCHEVEIG
jgi:hypothetical protein